jgi:hypothetical protein
MTIRFTPVSVDYFRLLQIPLLKGRLFTASDDDTSTPVAIISESLAQRLWPNQDPLGRHLTRTGSKPVTREIIGVVRDVKHLGDFPDEEVYAPDLQEGGLGYPDVMVRVDRHAADLPAAIRREILAVDAEALVSEVSLLEQKSRIPSTERLNTLPGPLPVWRCCWRAWASTARLPMQSPAGRTRSAFAWPWVPAAAMCCKRSCARDSNSQRLAWPSVWPEHWRPPGSSAVSCTTSVPRIRLRSYAWPSSWLVWPCWPATSPPAGRRGSIPWALR